MERIASALQFPRRALLFFAFASGCFLAGCSRPEPAADFVIVNGVEPETLDPHTLTGQPDGRIAAAMFEGLTRYEPTNAATVPGTASNAADAVAFVAFLLSPEAQMILKDTGQPPVVPALRKGAVPAAIP